MLVDHLLEAGGSGAVVPWYNVRKDLFLDKVRRQMGGRWWEAVSWRCGVGLALRSFVYYARQQVAGGEHTCTMGWDGMRITWSLRMERKCA